MIYSASMGPYVKKAFAARGFQTNIKKIIELLPMSPKMSHMDAVVLGPKDLRWALGQSLLEAIERKHPDVSVFYVYQKEKDEELITNQRVAKLMSSKLSPDAIRKFVEEQMDLASVREHNQSVNSLDNLVMDREDETSEELLQAEEETAAAVAEELEQEKPVSKTIEQRIEELGSYADFDLLKSTLSKDQVLGDLLATNMQYVDLLKTLDSFDQAIESVFTDDALTAEERFSKIKEIGAERAALKGLEGSIVADKTASIMQAIIRAAEATVEARIEKIRSGLDIISSAKLLHENQEQLQEIIDSRLRIQMDLMELSKEMIELYKAMDHKVSEIAEDLQAAKPAKNDYINEVLRSEQEFFLPYNMPTVVNRLISDLRDNKVTFSIMEDKIRSCINLVFKLCEEDATIIAYQQRLIQLLKTQRVENVVVIDNIIKNSLRLFVGPSDAGRTATALTWSGIVSRRQNTLLLDLSGASKLHDYGVDVVDLKTFLAERIERPFLCVSGDGSMSLEEADGIISELKSRLTYYAHIHVVLDADQIELMNRMAGSALAVHFITDCTPRGIALAKRAAEAFQEENIARKAILIDPPVDPLKLLSELTLDPMMVKVIIIPRLTSMKVCSIYRTKPYENEEIVELFEEAFR